MLAPTSTGPGSSRSLGVSQHRRESEISSNNAAATNTSITTTTTIPLNSINGNDATTGVSSRNTSTNVPFTPTLSGSNSSNNISQSYLSSSETAMAPPPLSAPCVSLQSSQTRPPLSIASRSTSFAGSTLHPPPAASRASSLPSGFTLPTSNSSLTVAAMERQPRARGAAKVLLHKGLKRVGRHLKRSHQKQSGHHESSSGTMDGAADSRGITKGTSTGSAATAAGGNGADRSAVLVTPMQGDGNDASSNSSGSSDDSSSGDNAHNMHGADISDRGHFYDLTDSTHGFSGVLKRLESGLRSSCFLLGAYLLGAFHGQSQLSSLAQKTLEYVVVAWITCVIIHVASLRATVAAHDNYHHKGKRGRYGRSSRRMHQDTGIPFSEPNSLAPYDDFSRSGTSKRLEERLKTFAEPVGIAASPSRQDSHASSCLSVDPTVHAPLTACDQSASPAENSPNYRHGMADKRDRKTLLSASIRNAIMPHPALEPFFVINMANGERIIPNLVHQPTTLETDYFTGYMMVFIRTPDVDDSKNPVLQGAGDVLTSGAESKSTVSEPSTAAAVQYMTSKQRRFEFQFQIRLKKVPIGRVLFSCELHDTIKMGMIQRAFVSAAMAFVKTTNNSFHYSLTGQPPRSDGMFEFPHMSFPVEECINRVVVTPPGQEPPVLGQEIFESAESIKKRKKGLRLDWNLEDTYTFSLWSAYVDFLQWRCMNLPGIRPFDLANIIGKLPIYLTLYEIPEDKMNDKHYMKDIITISKFEMCNAVESTMGPAALEWCKNNTGDTSQVKGKKTDMNGDINIDLNNDNNAPENLVAATEEDAVAELGEGIYVKSGDIVTFRESLSKQSSNKETASFVTYAGGFAVLQEKSSSDVIIEKVGRGRSKSNRSPLIKSGDTVRFKLVTKGRHNDEPETLYLSIHRGWWLKWVANAPTKNGFFTIYTSETEFGDEGDIGDEVTVDTQSAYLTLGGSFWLRHKRWSKYHVGVSPEGSATYGGRMLGLFTPKTNNSNSPEFDDDPMYQHDEGEFNMEPEPPGGKNRTDWLQPVLFCAFEPNTGNVNGSLPKPSEDTAEQPSVDDNKKAKLVFSANHLRMDVPAWVEMMNRADRVRQLAYVVRVSPREALLDDDETEQQASATNAFFRLRTGREVSKVMRAGLHWRSNRSPLMSRRLSLENLAAPVFRMRSSDGISPMRSRAFSSPSAPDNVENLNQVSQHQFVRLSTRSDNDEEGSRCSKDEASSSSDDEWVVESGDEAEATDEISELLEAIKSAEVSGSNDIGKDAETADLLKMQKGRSRKFIGKLAQTVKSRTTNTGKTVVRHSVKVGKEAVSAGKATMNAGKAMIVTRRPKKPPSKEPRSAKGVRYKASKHKERDLHVAVSRSMRRVAKSDQYYSLIGSPAFVAGQLNAPELSCRTVSSMLFEMSNVPPTSDGDTDYFSPLLSSLAKESDQDRLFLSGGAMQVGVVPDSVACVTGLLRYGSLVARCLWESHWREEWCGIYEKSVAFYAPLTNVPCLELSFSDVQCVRPLEAGMRSPLPGLSILVLETAWKCFYIAFADKDARNAFSLQINEVLASSNLPHESELDLPELRQARFWQGFQNSIKISVSSGHEKWADIVSDTKSKTRLILNNRRMVFDLEPPRSDYLDLAENLLSTSLSFSLQHLTEHPDALIQFLDCTSQLRGVNLDELDLSSSTSFCFFINVYHCLLQHAMLLSINGPLHKRSCEHFMRSSCYEIGGDVFSLAELHSCVIRGNMSKPFNAKPPFIIPPKKSNSYRYYALKYTTPVVNFILNYGNMCCPREVPVLSPENLDLVMCVQATEFLRLNISVDEARAVIVLPKVCETYKFDFLTSSNETNPLLFCLQFLDEETVATIQALLEDESSTTIKYQQSSDQYHSTLKERVFERESPIEV